MFFPLYIGGKKRGKEGGAGRRAGVVRTHRETASAGHQGRAGHPRRLRSVQSHGGDKTPVGGSGGKTGDVRENGADWPGRTAGRPGEMADRPRKTAAPPEKPAKPPPAAGAGRGACDRRAGGPEDPLGFPPEGPLEGLRAAPETPGTEPPARGERRGPDSPMRGRGQV